MDYSANQRLREFCDCKGVSESELAVQLNLSRQSVNSWWANRRLFPLKHLYKLKKIFPDLDEEWFVSGLGPSTPDSPPADPDPLATNGTDGIPHPADSFPALFPPLGKLTYQQLEGRVMQLEKELNEAKFEIKNLNREIGSLLYNRQISQI